MKLPQLEAAGFSPAARPRSVPDRLVAALASERPAGAAGPSSTRKESKPMPAAEFFADLSELAARRPVLPSP